MKLKDYLKTSYGFENETAISYEAFESAVDIYKETIATDIPSDEDIDKAINIVTMYHSGFEDNKEEIVEYLNELAKDSDMPAFESSKEDTKDSIGGKIKSVAIAAYRAIIDAIKSAYVSIKSLGKKLLNLQPLLKRKAEKAVKKINTANNIDFSKLESHKDDIDYVLANTSIGFFIDNLKPVDIDEDVDVCKFVKPSYEFDRPVKLNLEIDTKYGKLKPIITNGNMALICTVDGFKTATMDGYSGLNNALHDRFMKFKPTSKEANIIYEFVEKYGIYIDKLQKFIDEEKKIEKLNYREDTETAEQMARLKDAKEVMYAMNVLVKVAPKAIRNIFKIIDIITEEK